jgi:hypothetical protein
VGEESILTRFRTLSSSSSSIVWSRSEVWKSSFEIGRPSSSCRPWKW